MHFPREYHEKGYGACWMNEPAIAEAEINRILSVPPEERLISLIPVGYPAYTPRAKEMKDLTEVFRVV
jgi:nitroreductase